MASGSENDDIVAGSEGKQSAGVLKIIQLCQNAPSQEALADALRCAASIIKKTHDKSVHEEVASYLIRNIIVVGENDDLQASLDQSMGACDVLAALSSCSSLFFEASITQPTAESSPTALQAALRYVRQRFLSVPQSEAQVEWIISLFNEEEAKSVGMGMGLLQGMLSTLLRIPSQVSNACHRQKITLPLWITRPRYLSTLVQCSMKMDVVGSGCAATRCFLHTLVWLVVQSGGSDEVATGMVMFFRLQSTSAIKFSDQNLDVLRAIVSTRDKMTLLRSILRHKISEMSPFPTNDLESECRQKVLPYLMLTCHPLLNNSDNLQEAWVRFMIFTSSSVLLDDAQDNVLCWSVAMLIASCTHKNSEAQTLGESDKNVASRDNPDAVVRRHVYTTAQSWSEKVFVKNADLRLQGHVSRFLLCCLRLFKEEREDLGSPIVAPLLQGVTVRLESSIVEIRRSGMEIGEALAARLGQQLRFEELDSYRSEHEDKPAPVPIIQEASKAKTTRKERPRRSRNLDPDEEYISSDEDSETLGSEEKNDDNDDANSDFGENFMPYDLDDDEQDLRETPVPLYLRDCLELLRTPETEESAASHHQAALEVVADLVSSHPSDLQDVAVPLARQLLHMENKFGDEKFVQNRMSGIVSLVVEEPVTVADYIISEVFESSGLGTRLDMLSTLEQGALLLCGAKELAKTKHAKFLEIVGEEPTRGQSLVKDTRTRRWRTRPTQVRVVNRFWERAPIWFYSLMNRFMEKKGDAALWGGVNGARLLSRLLLTLGCIVECSGTAAAGTSIMAKDLVDFSWSFQNSDVGELRSSVLLAAATGLSHLDDETAQSALLGGSLHSLPRALRRISEEDPNVTCRQLAVELQKRCQMVLAPAIAADGAVSTKFRGLQHHQDEAL